MRLSPISYAIASMLNRALKLVAPRTQRLLRNHSRVSQLYQQLRWRTFIRGTPAERFTAIYKNRWWGSDALSGEGSTLTYTENIRRVLPGLLRDLHVRRVLDAPCGDFLWFKELTLDIDSYIGGDIVPALVERNNALFRSPSRSFKTIDIAVDPLPSSDLWLCRDCFIHLDYNQIFRTLINLAHSDIKYFLVSNYPLLKRNKDSSVGAFRALNLLLPPFDLPAPIITIEDYVEGYDVRNLSLWRTEDIRDFLLRHMQARRRRRSIDPAR